MIRHLHLYGQPLEALIQQKQFDIASGTYKIMDIGVRSKERTWMKSILPKDLKPMLTAKAEIAFLDVREHGQ